MKDRSGFVTCHQQTTNTMEIVLSDKNRPMLNSALASRIKEVASKDSVVGTALKGLGLAGFYLLLVYAMAKIYQRTLNADDQRFVIKEKEKKNAEPSIDFADLWAGGNLIRVYFIWLGKCTCNQYDSLK